MIKIIFYTLIYAALSVSGSTLIKQQLNGKNLETFNEWFELMFNLPFILGFLLIVFSALTFFKALSAGSFSMIIPIATGIHFILTIGVDYFLFNGRFSFLSFIGFILIISGIIVLSLNNQAHA